MSIEISFLDLAQNAGRMVQAVEKKSITVLSCKQIPSEPWAPPECERRDTGHRQDLLEELPP